MVIQRTFLAIKPDGVQRKLTADIIGRFERRGYRMVACKLIVPQRSLLEEHYAEHAGRPFLPGLITYMSSGAVLAMVWEGEEIVAEARVMIGATQPAKAAVGTIRKDFCQVQERNVIHGSDSIESAEREIALWFSKDELCDYKSGDAPYVYPSA